MLFRSIVDVNKNTQKASPPEESQKIKQVDILPGKDPNHRFKSTYNGPMGDYKPHTLSSDEPTSKPLQDSKHETETKKSEEVFLPPVPPRPDKNVETVTVSATIETHEEEEDETPQQSPVKEKTPSPVKEKSPGKPPEEDEQIIRETPIKYSRTKSQEFRDYQHEFMVSSIIDFGPLQPVKPSQLTTSTPISKPAPAKSRRDPSPVVSPVRKLSSTSQIGRAHV